jgi:hypothetical protein
LASVAGGAHPFDGWGRYQVSGSSTWKRVSPGVEVKRRSPWWRWTTDAPADVEPEAGALADRLGGVEGLRDIGGGLGDAGAVVADLDQDPVAVAGGADGQPTGAVHAGRTRCPAVHLGWLVDGQGQHKALCHAGSAVRRI